MTDRLARSLAAWVVAGSMLIAAGRAVADGPDRAAGQAAATIRADAPPTIERIAPSSVVDLAAAMTNPRDRQTLTEQVHGDTISLTCFSDVLRGEPIDKSHLSLKLKKAGKSLLNADFVEAGRIWLENGSVYLQLAGGDPTPALTALKYSVLRVKDADANPTVMTFAQPETVAVVLGRKEPVAVKIPTAVAARVKLTTRPSSGWGGKSDPDGTLRLEKQGLKLAVKFDPGSGVVATADSPDSDHVRAQLDSRTKGREKAQGQLDAFNQQAAVPPKVIKPRRRIAGIWYPPQLEDRSVLMKSIDAVTGQIKDLDKEIARLEAAKDAVDARVAVLGNLDQLGLALVLPNGVDAADINLSNGN